MNYTFEALISLLIFLMIVASLKVSPPVSDYTLYRYILAEDIWRVLYLKHGPNIFIYFMLSGHINPEVNMDIIKMREETGLCINFNIENSLNTCKNPVIIKYPVVGPINYYLAVGLPS